MARLDAAGQNELQLEVVSSSIFGPDFLIGEEIEDLPHFRGGPLSFLTPQNLLMANGKFLREKVRCVEVVGFEAVISGAVDSIELFIKSQLLVI